ncbi:hypothetical protein L596_025321 [Steinernema carpocapsae]|uniref:Uncharacterized protein n=1 Tax=Steinernema carpocapsae TaxID=34508 RepID=A0A4U5M8A5_STECR|nr:hypothetical protein L596_025321 [Steinernema carpocapsae]
MHNVPFIFREEVVGLLPSPQFGITHRFDFDAIPDDLWRAALEESWKNRPTLWTTLYRRDGEWYYDITHADKRYASSSTHLPMAVDPSIEELKKSDLRFLRFCHFYFQSADDEYFRRFTPILIAHHLPSIKRFAEFARPFVPHPRVPQEFEGDSRSNRLLPIFDDYWAL